MQQTHATDAARQDAGSRPLGTTAQRAAPLEVWLRVRDVHRTGPARVARWRKSLAAQVTAKAGSRQRRRQTLTLAAAAVLGAASYWFLPIGGDRARQPERRPPPGWSTQQLRWRSPGTAGGRPDAPPTRAAQSSASADTARKTTPDASAQADESTASPPASARSDDTPREVLSGSDPVGPRLPTPASSVPAEPVTLLGIERADRSARHERSGPY